MMNILPTEKNTTPGSLPQIDLKIPLKTLSNNWKRYNIYYYVSDIMLTI